MFGPAPAAVVAFVPITVLSVTGVIGVAEIRQLRWDVLILMAGGLSLGVAVTETGLAAWLVGGLPLGPRAGRRRARLRAADRHCCRTS
jgi:solute carrier family 13 (sodium-dependent dicarboxylate transporter), member 2/3/5